MNDSVKTPLTCVALILGAILGGKIVGVLFGDGVPWELVIGRGIVFGGINALLAAGLVFVFRAAKVVNFSQAGFGALAALLYLNLRDAWGWNFWLAIAASIAAAVLAGLFLEIAILRRFSNAPRLVLTVVTIALGQTLLGFALVLPERFGFVPDPETGLQLFPTQAPDTPFASAEWTWGKVVFNGNQVAAIATAVIALALLAAFLRFTRAGTAIRGAAENRDRAAQLGIDVASLSSIVWIIVAGLGAAAAILSMLAGAGSMSSTIQQSANAFGVGILLRGLAPAVVARMQNLPIAVAGAYAVAMFEESVRWATGQDATVDLVLLLVVVVALLVQRRGESRVAADEASTWEASEEIRSVPAELAHLPAVKRGMRRVLWGVAIVVLAYPWLMSPSQTNTGGLYAIYGMVGVSLVILTGWGGQISLGQFGFVAVGAVLGGWLTADVGITFVIALPLASLLCAGFAVLVGLPALRLQGLYLAVSSLAFALVCSTFLVNPRYFGWLLPDSIDRPSILWIDTGAGERVYYYVTLAGLAFAMFVAGGLRRSRTGRLLIAMRENERASQSFTINVVRTRLTAFAFSGFLAGMAGVLFAHHQGSIGADSFSAERSISMFLMAVIGGLGSVYTVIVGAIFFATINVILSGDGAQLAGSGISVLLILMFFPSGLGSLIFRTRDGWLRRIAMRHRIFVPSLAGGRLKEGDEARIPIGPRPDEVGDIPSRYELEGSSVSEQGKSQITKVWRY